MEGSLLENNELHFQNKPFYKRKLFMIGVGGIVSITTVIIVIVVCSSKSIKFSSNSFVESKEFIRNPDQGYYLPAKVVITPNNVTYPNNFADQIYHLRCDLSEFSGVVNTEKKDKEMTKTALDGLDKYLNRIKSLNKNAVIRFCYDKYNGTADMEPELSMIEKHIKQLGTILNKYLDTLTAIEAGMLGKWGEMHTSKIATNENKAKIFRYWLENTKDIPILSRYPEPIFFYFNKTFEEMENFTISRDDKGSRLGLFDDCFLSSWNDHGTYRINREREIKWLSTINDHLPFGGETCAMHNKSDLEIAIPEMRLLSLSHLNNVFHKDVINKWKALTYNSTLGNDSLYYGMSAYDYINAHFGYRLVIRSIDISYTKGDKFELSVNIDNVGFGNLLKAKKIDIIYTNLENTILKNEREVGIYKGENILKIEGTLLDKDHDDYKVFIRLYSSLENNTVYYPVQFANEKIYNETIAANLIFNVNKEGKIFV